MTYLLDTHTFLWAIDQHARLSRRVRSILSNERNDLLLSAASLWEIIVKFQAGRLEIPATVEYFDAHMGRLGIGGVLPVSPTHVFALLKLTVSHKDPFDRILAAQCVVERVPLLSADSALRRYPIEVIW